VKYLTAQEHPIDETTMDKLRGVMFPKEPPYGKWTLPDQLITKTLKTYLEGSTTLEEFIAKVGKAAEHEQDALLRIVLSLVKERTEMYLSGLKDR
jgi:hypothetical protein